MRVRGERPRAWPRFCAPTSRHLTTGARAALVVADYRKAVGKLERAGELFDLLFVDPPYRMLAEVEVDAHPSGAQTLCRPEA